MPHISLQTLQLKSLVMIVLSMKNDLFIVHAWHAGILINDMND